MSWAPSGFRGKARHAPAYAPDGSRYMIPPYQLCTGKEGRIEVILPERIDCKRCLKKQAEHDALSGDKAAMRAWLEKNGVRS